MLQGMVKELTATEAHLSNGDVLPYGMAVWSTGVGPTTFTTGLPFAKTAKGRIAIDGQMRVLQHIDPDRVRESEPHKPSDVSNHTCNALCWHIKQLAMCACIPTDTVQGGSNTLAGNLWVTIMPTSLLGLSLGQLFYLLEYT